MSNRRHQLQETVTETASEPPVAPSPAGPMEKTIRYVLLPAGGEGVGSPVGSAAPASITRAVIPTGVFGQSRGSPNEWPGLDALSGMLMSNHAVLVLPASGQFTLPEKPFDPPETAVVVDVVEVDDVEVDDVEVDDVVELFVVDVVVEVDDVEVVEVDDVVELVVDDVVAGVAVQTDFANAERIVCASIASPGDVPRRVLRPDKSDGSSPMGSPSISANMARLSLAIGSPRPSTSSEKSAAVINVTNISLYSRQMESTDVFQPPSVCVWSKSK